MDVILIFITNFALTKSVIWKSKSKQTEETSKLANRNPLEHKIYISYWTPKQNLD